MFLEGYIMNQTKRQHYKMVKLLMQSITTRYCAIQSLDHNLFFFYTSFFFEI